MTSSTSSSRLAAVLAVVAPAAIVASALAFLGRPEADTSETVAPEVTQCIAATAKAENGVVLVGNSKSGTDIDRAALAKALGVPDIGKIGAPGSSAPLWYAALERCVFAEGHRPKLVIVYGTAGAMLRATIDSQLEGLLLAPYLGASEPVLDRKVFGGAATSPFWQRVRTRKTEAVLGLQHGVRDLVSGLFFAPPSAEGLLAAGRAHAEPALAAVLGADAGAEAVTRHRAIPIADTEPTVRTAKDTTIADTLVPDLVALAKDNGARIVFVAAPLSAAKVDIYDVSDPALVREMVAALNAAGAGFLDLTTLGLPASAYGDGIHMNSNGRALLTAALADRLADVDALGAAPFAPAPLPRIPAHVRRDGPAPALPAPTAPKRGPWDCGWQMSVPGLDGISDSALGRIGIGAVSPLLVLEDGAPLKPHARREEFDLTCAGGFAHQNGVVKFTPTGGPADVVASRSYTLALSDAAPLLDPYGRAAWWVYPGTTLRAEAAEGWASPLDGFAVGVEAVVAIPGAAPATVTWGDLAAPVVVTGADAVATVPGPTPTGPFAVEVRSPPDGPWLLVRRVVAGTRAAPWYMVGAADAGRTVDLFKGALAYAGDPPPIGTLGRIYPAKEGGWRFDTTTLGAPNSDEVGKASGIAGCSPVLVAEDGVPLPSPNSPLRIVRDTPGGYAHTAFGILFSPPDGTSPLENGRTYTASLLPDRACRSGRWVYPGDVARFTVPAAMLARLSGGATRLDLTAAAFGGDAAAAITVRVLVGDEEVFAGAASLAGIDAAPPSWTLRRPIVATDPGVVVELSTPAGAPFTMLSALALVEPPRPAFPDSASAPPDDAPRGAGAAP